MRARASIAHTPCQLGIAAFGWGVNLTPKELERYSRHITLPQVGLEGQERLKAAKVLCIGAGGLGSPVAMYLAAAGVGELGFQSLVVALRLNLRRRSHHVAQASIDIAHYLTDICVIDHRLVEIVKLQFYDRHTKFAGSINNLNSTVSKTFCLK